MKSIQSTLYFIASFSLLIARTPWDYTISLASGYDSNVMRFSVEEIDNASQTPDILGRSTHFDSFISKFGFSSKKDLWISKNRNLSMNTKFSLSSYVNAQDKRYWSSGLDLIYKWGSYKNIKFSLRHLDKFYLRHYVNKDISTNRLEACYFSDRDQIITVTQRITKYSWINIGAGYLQRYYEKPFTEFDLDIINLRAKLNYKLKRIGTLALQVNQGRALSESHIGPIRPSSFDRSYNTREVFLPFKFKYNGPFLSSFGFSYRAEKRTYDAEDPNDVLHAGRSHIDRKYDLWIRKSIGEDISIKISSRYRSRVTDSAFQWVSNLKSFNQIQYWVNIEWDLMYDKY
ncbi:MAG: hypothetical protein CMG55_07030 [Candidatus Marinimicrobia bacterium]|nr:hypothetical protein [Candidatus Neomarinimicrobiota bacterium]|tara:strand:+ start:79 stop:1110 length:1032 start_codon:yes stop_codon:yes gene_type:complete